MSNIDSNIYLDTNTLLNWKDKISTINNNSINKINNINNHMKKLDLCLAGNIAEGIKYDIGRLTKQALQYHESMKDVENMLSEIVEKRLEQ